MLRSTAVADGSQQVNPAMLAALQSQPSGVTPSDDWAAAMDRILALTTRNPEAFRQQPQANRFSAILEAVVPSRTNPTHEKVLAIVNALVESKAIRKDEAGLIYNALLERVARYNSTNVQANLDRLTTDVREAVAQRERFMHDVNLGSQVALNAFLSTLPANVPRGQERILDKLAGRNDPMRHDDRTCGKREGAWVHKGLGSYKGGDCRNTPAGGVRRMRI